MPGVSRADALVSGPRGRRLCWNALDAQSFERTGRYQLRGVGDGGTARILRVLQSIDADSDLEKYASSSDVVGFLEFVADSVDRARHARAGRGR